MHTPLVSPLEDVVESVSHFDEGAGGVRDYFPDETAPSDAGGGYYRGGVPGVGMPRFGSV